jgi:hypothetical protein
METVKLTPFPEEGNRIAELFAYDSSFGQPNCAILGSLLQKNQPKSLGIQPFWRPNLTGIRSK